MKYLNEGGNQDIVLNAATCDPTNKLQYQFDLTCTELCVEQKQEVLAIISEYRDVFSVFDDDLCQCNLVKNHIHSIDDVPIKQSDRWVFPRLVSDV